MSLWGFFFMYDMLASPGYRYPFLDTQIASTFLFWNKKASPIRASLLGERGDSNPLID